MPTGTVIAQSIEALWGKLVGFVPVLVVAIVVLVLGWVLGNGLGPLVKRILEAADILGLSQVSVFLYSAVLPYFGSVIVAVAIMLIGIVAANFLQGLVRHSLNAGGLHSADSLGLITKWAVLIFAFLATLSQLGVAAAFVQDLFRALVAMLAIAGGIAFGMGGREHARKVLDAIEKDLTGK